MALRLMKTGAYDRGNLRVLMYLASKHDWRSGQAYPEMPTIATETGLSERTVKRCVAYLEERGVIRCVRGNGRGHRSCYEFPLLESKSPEQREIGFEKGVTSDPERVTPQAVKGDTAGVERVTPQPVKGDTASDAIRKEKESKELQKENQKPNRVFFRSDDQPQTPNPWSEIKALLRQRINPHSWDTWMRPTQYSHEAGGVIFIRIPNECFHYGREKFNTQISEAIADLRLDLQDVKFLTDLELDAVFAAEMAPRCDPAPERRLALVAGAR